MSTPNEIVRSFFRRHHAVPAADAGPTWSQANETVLLDLYASVAAIVECGWNRDAKRNATAAERAGNAQQYREVVGEIRRRAAKADASPEIMAAYFRCLHAKKA
jgi:hypothetical protein